MGVIVVSIIVGVVLLVVRPAMPLMQLVEEVDVVGLRRFGGEVGGEANYWAFLVKQVPF